MRAWKWKIREGYRVAFSIIIAWSHAQGVIRGSRHLASQLAGSISHVCGACSCARVRRSSRFCVMENELSPRIITHVCLQNFLFHHYLLVRLTTFNREFLQFPFISKFVAEATLNTQDQQGDIRKAKRSYTQQFFFFFFFAPSFFL